LSTLAEQEQRWLSGKHIGSSKPILRAWVRTGHLEREYRNLPDDEVFCYVPGLKGPNAVWKAHWVPETDYEEVPNVITCKGENDFEQNGVEQITLEADNVDLAEHTGLAGIFHTFERGFMAPTRGDAGFQAKATGSSTQWRGVFKDQSTQIIITAGYGEAHFPVFLGLLDDCDLSSAPDKIVITARSMGKFLTDQHTFMDAKNLFVRDPITFCDRQRADETEDVARNATAKSDDGSHFARFATDEEDDETAWISEGHGSPDELEWIEFSVPHSRIEDFMLLPRFAGMEMFVSVYATNTNVQGGGPARTTDGHDVGEGWVDFEKLGNVPGTEIPFVKAVNSVKGEKGRYKVRAGGGGYVLGDGSKVRLWFRNLKKVSSGKQWSYRAGVFDCEILARTRKEAAKNFHWILVDDVSDIVKTVLQWVGIDDWEIETVGSRLKDKIVFDRSSFLIDIIRKITEATSYIFYLRPPEEFDTSDLSPGNKKNLSMGVAVFRQNEAMTTRPRDKRYTVKDDNVITGIQPQFTGAPLAQSIRVRGKLISSWKALKDPNYVPKPNDNVGRFFYNYRPVWARGGSAAAGHGAAGLRKHEFHTDPLISSNYECKVACLLIAFRMALQASACTVQVPFFPPINLDQQLAVYDEGTGLSSRIWVATRDWEYVGGEERRFAMTLGGSLLDIDIVEQTRVELRKVLNNAGYDPAPIPRGPWEKVHFF
jgi:hypothetical protein